ncbi:MULTISPECIES: YjcZ family sporulation protein [Sutcliffiella]|uniref:Sporulation protein YjcZ n=1 Tax=Sutcliffiella cohnii TaxID=33932 RepID=A0A223KQ62_9BACI|nr:MULTISPECIES: YjcZ family sporulation protein [Sutcliffiella]AST91478.1 sporulation protein YjcZ [Sutcliffiella cohnii]WBL17310.1 YjcZ family sporulation protein [Sutcliffiella sp. NC1]
MSKGVPTASVGCFTGGFTLYIILFILLVIIGAAFLGY